MSSNKYISSRGLINLYMRLIQKNRIKRNGAAFQRLIRIIQNKKITKDNEIK